MIVLPVKEAFNQQQYEACCAVVGGDEDKWKNDVYTVQSGK